jgi:maltose alpha-D-glucosyltransferase/alpha-amylase
VTAPAWLDTAIFYQIYPQSFFDANGDGIGDLAGVTAKLDYLVDLGVNAIWINPIYVSPFRDGGYDIVDHKRIDARYGSNDDVALLLEAAHAREIRVCLDLVPGHTSDQHPWFKASAKAEANEFSDRFIWTTNPWVKRDEALDFISGNSDRMGAYAINFFAHQPALNYGFAMPRRGYQQPLDAPGPRATLAALQDVMAFWLDRGVDGFRVDLAGSLVKGDPEQTGVRRLWRELSEWMRQRYPERVLIAEWGRPEMAIDAGFDVDFMLPVGTPGYDALLLGPDTFPRRPTYPYFDDQGRGDFGRFFTAYEFQRTRVAGRGHISLPSANHDMSRPRLGRDVADLKVLFTFLLTWPQVPFIYYGDEIGMHYLGHLPSKEGGYQRTGSRTPMQWDGSALAGFSASPSVRPYLPVDSAPDRPDVAAQLADKDSLWHHVNRLIYLRVTERDLTPGARLELLTPSAPGYPLAYRRGDSLIVAINPGPVAAVVELPTLGDVNPVLSHHCRVEHARGWRVRIGPTGYGVFSVT